MQQLDIKPLENEHIEAVVEMEHTAWHQYYSQYDFYDLVKDSETKAEIKKNWQAFIGKSDSIDTPLIAGYNRKAYVALVAGKVVGVGAVSAFKENTWNKIDDILRQPDGIVKKTAKFQNLYIDDNYRGNLIGHYLTLARADYMLALGYQAIFMTTYAAAIKTNEYHKKNSMEHIYDYESLQTYKGGKKVKISCFLNQNLEAYRQATQNFIDKRLKQGKGFEISGFEV